MSNAPELTERQYAYVYITGPGTHADVTRVLQLTPSEAWNPGDTNPRNGRPYRSMKWTLRSDLDDTRSLEEHIGAVLDVLGTRAVELRSLWLDYDIVLQCVSHHPSWTYGLHFDRELVRQLAGMGLAVDFDFYAVHPHDDD